MTEPIDHGWPRLPNFFGVLFGRKAFPQNGVHIALSRERSRQRIFSPEMPQLPRLFLSQVHKNAPLESQLLFEIRLFLLELFLFLLALLLQPDVFSLLFYPFTTRPGLGLFRTKRFCAWRCAGP